MGRQLLGMPKVVEVSPFNCDLTPVPFQYIFGDYFDNSLIFGMKANKYLGVRDTISTGGV